MFFVWSVVLLRTLALLAWLLTCLRACLHCAGIVSLPSQPRSFVSSSGEKGGVLILSQRRILVGDLFCSPRSYAGLVAASLLSLPFFFAFSLSPSQVVSSFSAIRRRGSAPGPATPLVKDAPGLGVAGQACSWPVKLQTAMFPSSFTRRFDILCTEFQVLICSSKGTTAYEVHLQ